MLNCIKWTIPPTFLTSLCWLVIMGVLPCWCLDHKAGVKSCLCVHPYVVAAVTSEARVQSYRSLLFFQGTADVMAGLEAIRIHSGCEWTHQVHTQTYTLSLSVGGSVTATCSVGPKKSNENAVVHSVLLFRAVCPHPHHREGSLVLSRWRRVTHTLTYKFPI